MIAISSEVETSTEKQIKRTRVNDELDLRYGYDRHKDPSEKVGWLINMHPVLNIVIAVNLLMLALLVTCNLAADGHT